MANISTPGAKTRTRPQPLKMPREPCRVKYFCRPCEKPHKLRASLLRIAAQRQRSFCRRGAVHHHVLVHAESEWLAFNQTVTDWERRRYFERI